MAARTTLDAAARPTVAWAADTVFEDVDVRGVTALRAVTFANAPPGALITDCVLVTVVVGRRVAERDADAPDTALPPADDDAATRRTSRPSLRALAVAGDDATDVPRGLGAWAAKPWPPANKAVTINETLKICAALMLKIYFSLLTFYHVFTT